MVSEGEEERKGLKKVFEDDEGKLPQPEKWKKLLKSKKEQRIPSRLTQGGIHQDTVIKMTKIKETKYRKKQQTAQKP